MSRCDRRRHTTRLRARLAGLAATLGLLAVVAGLPIVLVVVGADPLPERVPDWAAVQAALTSPDDGTLFLRAIAVVAWVAWAFITVSVLTEVRAALRGVRAPHLPALPGLRLSQGAARSLVATAALLFVAVPAFPQSGWIGGVPASGAVPVGASHPASVAQSLQGVDDLQDAGTHSPETTSSADVVGHHRGDTQHSRASTNPHTVGPGETLWSIARTYLGDGARFPEIVELNRDLLGDDPGFLEIGWVLHVPDRDQGGDAVADASTSVELQDGERAVLVQPGDTLSDIADTELGDPTAFPEIFKASKDIAQPGGARLTDADMIDVGWTLIVPADGAGTGPMPRGSSGTNHHTSEGQPGHGPATRPGDRHNSPLSGTPTNPPADPPADPPVGPTDTAPAIPGRVDPERRVDERGNAPEADEVNEGDEGDEVAGFDEIDSVDPPWLLIGLTGGGAVLAAGLHRLLRARRRAQWRARRPGRAIAVPGPELAPAEKTISIAGATVSATAEFMDEALRRLALQHARDERPMPAIAAVELTRRHLVLHLTDATTLDPPWEGTADAMHWRCGTDVVLCDIGGAGHEAIADQPAPYPMLATIGASEDGDVWLLNLEELAAVTISGDRARGRDLARYIAAELATNPWSAGIVVDCVGIADEVAPMERDRIRHHRPGAEGDRAADETLADAVAAIDRSRQAGSDIVTGRAAQLGDDAWPARLLLIDLSRTGRPAQSGESGDSPEEDATASNGSPEPASLHELLRLAVDHAGRTGTAVALLGERPGGLGTVLHLTSAGRVQLAAAGLDLVSVGLTSEEAHGCAALLAQSEDQSDTNAPVDESVTEGWGAYITQSGSLRSEYTLPRAAAPGTTSDATTVSHLDYTGPGPSNEPIPAASDESEDETDVQDERTESLLTGCDQDYVTAAAVTAEDLAALAPEVSVDVRAEVEAATQALDKDVADWFNAHSSRPKLTLLGPVSAQAHGKALVERRAYFTELLTYLALRRRNGATPDEVAAAFNLQPTKVRGYVKVVRDWLGTNPATGTKHLPDATDAPATKRTGVNVYQVDDGLLVDVDLFRQLWARGQARGPAGIHDLRQALDLVVGRPFDQLRKGAWSWLLEGDRTDLQMQAAVADVAHLVATHSLTTGDLRTARHAVDKAMLAAPDEDTTHLNRAALAAAEGFPEEAERILRDEVCNRSDDGHAPLDLTQRADAILRNHDWMATG